MRFWFTIMHAYIFMIYLGELKSLIKIKCRLHKVLVFIGNYPSKARYLNQVHLLLFS
jgi:hypothetical protein